MVAGFKLCYFLIYSNYAIFFKTSYLTIPSTLTVFFFQIKIILYYLFLFLPFTLQYYQTTCQSFFPFFHKTLESFELSSRCILHSQILKLMRQKCPTPQAARQTLLIHSSSLHQTLIAHRSCPFFSVWPKVQSITATIPQHKMFINDNAIPSFLFIYLISIMDQKPSPNSLWKCFIQ